MNLEKIYYDAEGKECNILELVKREPEWAVNRIQEAEKHYLRWISVKDRLPEEDKYCLIFFNNSAQSKGIDCAYYYGDQEWSLEEHITHWMPLPEPPKEKHCICTGLNEFPNVPNPDCYIHGQMHKT